MSGFFSPFHIMDFFFVIFTLYFSSKHCYFLKILLVGWTVNVPFTVLKILFLELVMKASLTEKMTVIDIVKLTEGYLFYVFIKYWNYIHRHVFCPYSPYSVGIPTDNVCCIWSNNPCESKYLKTRNLFRPAFPASYVKVAILQHC